MDSMSRICFFFLFFGAIGLGGCGKSQNRTDKVPIDGIKLGNLATGPDEAMPPRIGFRVFTFELPAQQVDLLKETFALMSKRQIRFADRDAFEANGFLAGFGTQQDWPALSVEMDKLVARRTATRNVVVYEAAGDDISVTLLNSTHDVAWIEAGGKAVRDTFAVGRFTWMLKARPLESVRGVAQVQISPVYKLGTQSFLSHLAQVRDHTAFSAAALDIRMGPGDYVLLGSAGEPAGLGGQSTAPFTLNRLLFYPAERPEMMRLFVVLCTRIDD
jgi:hypothetical protein